MEIIQSQNQHGDAPDRGHSRAPGTAVIQLGRVNESNLRGSAGSARNQKLATPTLIRILRRLVHRRAFQQRKAKPGTSHVEGPAAAAVASLERPSILIRNKWGPPDFKSRQATGMTALANAVFLCGAVLS